MRNESIRDSVESLKNMLGQVDLILSTTVPLPDNRTARWRELLAAALALADDLPKQKGTASVAALGSEGEA